MMEPLLVDTYIYNYNKGLLHSYGSLFVTLPQEGSEQYLPLGRTLIMGLGCMVLAWWGWCKRYGRSVNDGHRFLHRAAHAKKSYFHCGDTKNMSSAVIHLSSL